MNKLAITGKPSKSPFYYGLPDGRIVNRSLVVRYLRGGLKAREVRLIVKGS